MVMEASKTMDVTDVHYDMCLVGNGIGKNEVSARFVRHIDKNISHRKAAPFSLCVILNRLITHFSDFEICPSPFSLSLFLVRAFSHSYFSVFKSFRF